MKTQFSDAEETTKINEISGVKETSDETVATRGNVKETIKSLNKHIEEHYYDTEEVDYFFSKIWHWIKNHVVKTDYFINILGKITPVHKSFNNYDSISKKPISVGSVDSLSALIDEKIRSIQTHFSNADNTLPNGFVYVQLPCTDSPSILWPGTYWEDISYLFKGSYLRVDTDGIDYGNGVSPKFSNSMPTYGYEAFYGAEKTVEVQKEVIPPSVESSDTSNFQKVVSSAPFQHITPQNISVKIWKKVEADLTIFDIYDAANEQASESIETKIEKEDFSEIVSDTREISKSENEVSKNEILVEIEQLYNYIRNN